jgi:hypothetical protein
VQRSAEWDGPALEVLPYVVAGHTYVVSVAARFDPTEPAPSDKTLRLAASKTCTDATVAVTYGHLNEKISTGSWLRLTGTFKVELAGCSQLSRLVVYVETTAGAKTSSIQLDDFQFYDMTSPDQVDLGAAGAAGAAGASGAAAMAGTAGAPGAAAGAGAGMSSAPNTGNANAGSSG